METSKAARIAEIRARLAEFEKTRNMGAWRRLATTAPEDIAFLLELVVEDATYAD